MNGSLFLDRARRIVPLTMIAVTLTPDAVNGHGTTPATPHFTCADSHDRDPRHRRDRDASARSARAHRAVVDDIHFQLRGL
jgi:hypothetical protein